MQSWAQIYAKGTKREKELQNRYKMVKIHIVTKLAATVNKMAIRNNHKTNSY